MSMTGRDQADTPGMARNGRHLEHIRARIRARTLQESELGDKTSRLIWIDLEMTGLDPLRDHIIEIATVVTDGDLNIVSEGPNIVIHQPRSVMYEMDDWNTRHHTASGLFEEVLASRISTEEAERATLDFLGRHCRPRSSPMCGSSICQDRRFLSRAMPDLAAFFHYRNLDVSSIKILAGLWSPAALDGVEKDERHRARSDILASVAELGHYRRAMFQSGGGGSNE